MMTSITFHMAILRLGKKDDKFLTDKNDKTHHWKDYNNFQQVIRVTKKNTNYRNVALFVFQLVETEEVIQSGSFTVYV
jgi:hypothetical protein